MYYPEASRASAMSAGWPTAAEKTCCHFCRLLLHQSPPATQASSLNQPTTWRCPLCQGPCTSSNDSPLPRSSSRKPDSHVLMTRPDRSLNPATLACLPPCSLNVCPALQNKPSCPPISPRAMARVPAGSPLSMVSQHYPWRFSPATLMIDAVENP
jgi:hypothetical protein